MDSWLTQGGLGAALEGRGILRKIKFGGFAWLRF